MTTWPDVPADHPFGRDALPYGVMVTPAGSRIVVRYGDHALDLRAVADLEPDSAWARAWREPTLDTFLALGRRDWDAARVWLRDALADPGRQEEWAAYLTPVEQVSLALPFTVGDYVDCYASEHHATNVGRIFRPDGEALTPNWRHLPIGYHGRSQTVVVTGTIGDAALMMALSNGIDSRASPGLYRPPPQRSGAISDCAARHITPKMVAVCVKRGTCRRIRSTIAGGDCRYRSMATLLVRCGIFLIALAGIVMPAVAVEWTRPAIWQLLRDGKLEELSQLLDARQRDYEADWQKEDAMLMAFASLARPDTRMTDRLKKWAEAQPTSYVARVIYGQHLAELGWTMRGTSYIGEMLEWRKQEYDRLHEEALIELTAALQLTAKPTYAYSELIEIARGGTGPKSPAEWYALAVENTPYARDPAQRMLFATHPAWSRARKGSRWSEQDEFLAGLAERLRGTPALAYVLPMVRSEALIARGDDQWKKDDPLAGAAHYAEALRTERNRLTLNAYAKSLWRQKRYPEALAALDEAIAASSHWGTAWETRAQLKLAFAQRPEDKADAAKDMLAAAERGSRWSQREIGAAYARGDYGLAVDRQLALYWYQESAYAGFQDGMNSLARAYYDGFVDGKPDDNAAWQWWRTAERLGNKQAKEDMNYARAQNRLPTDAALSNEPPRERTVVESKRRPMGKVDQFLFDHFDDIAGALRGDLSFWKYAAAVLWLLIAVLILVYQRLR